jgi:glycosyltransferase involved in cell wall biosynthesis
VVVDDGSSDRTADIVRGFGAAVNLLQRPNSGVSAARNAGAAAARGRWLAFLDADDEWLPVKLETQMRLADEHTALIYCDRFNIGDRGQLPEIQSHVNPVSEGDIFEELLLRGNFVTASSVVVRADLFSALGGFYEGVAGTEDWDLWIRVSERHRVRVCREPLLAYRYHAENWSRSPERMWNARETVISRAAKLPRSASLGAAKWRRIRSRMWKDNASEAIRLRRRGLAISALFRAISYWPLETRPYKDLIRAVLNVTD